MGWAARLNLVAEAARRGELTRREDDGDSVPERKGFGRVVIPTTALLMVALGFKQGEEIKNRRRVVRHNRSFRRGGVLNS